MNEQDNLESKRRALSEEIVDRIASDETFRKEIVDDPATALTNAGFAERLQDLSDDVAGYASVNRSAAFVAAFSVMLGGGAVASIKQPVPPIPVDPPTDPPVPTPTTHMPSSSTVAKGAATNAGGGKATF